jgi:hypothetical protein
MDHHKQDEALSDEELARLVLQGKNSAFSILVKRHVTRFYKVVLTQGGFGRYYNKKIFGYSAEAKREKLSDNFRIFYQ